MNYVISSVYAWCEDGKASDDDDDDEREEQEHSDMIRYKKETRILS